MNRNSPVIGVIGIGLLGTAIAERLLHGTAPVYGYDRDPERMENFVKLGGTPAQSTNDVAMKSQLVFLCLPNSDVVTNVILDLQALRKQGQQAAIRTVIDSTTGQPDEVIANAEQLRELGIQYVEATVAGSSQQVSDGTALIFLGGVDCLSSEERKILRKIAPQQFELGAIGEATRFKLVHNLLLGLNRAVLAETLGFAEALGFDARRTLSILEQSPAASAVMQSKGQKMIKRDWSPQAKLTQHLKDVGIILSTASEAGARTPFSVLHSVLLEQCVRAGLGDADNSAIREAFDRLTEDGD
ncbi:2-hydroxy-3-oxopropionate reductase [Thalassoglobus neptunius]|uniref:2-hydroxy-3-oxopropionate reductase n=1 Tax=Thalassoglobus neptunius TaxID=1938619 RepID=A0A5C5X6W3_9PLAN|nr:NAD(P)-dependent oxidoreductase [Thalassoglobus neptunius]TWT57885.1 2-hydroxy-3-oxopropionate reductase [Thalassoglobus neptunius]